MIETARLRLEPWDADRHTAGLVAMNAEADVMRLIGEGRPATSEESQRQSHRFAQHWERYGFGLWAIHPRSTGVFAGFAGLSHPLWLPTEAGEVEVGWRLRRAAWGYGYATEAAGAALEVAFGVLGLERVISLIRPENERSRAVA